MVNRSAVGVTRLDCFKNNCCRICRKVFCCEVCRNKHENKVHNFTEKCDICISGKISAFSISSSLIDHLKNVHWPLHCVICQRLFASVEEIFYHKKCPIRHSSPLTNDISSNSPNVIYIGSGSKEYLSPFSPLEAMHQFGLQHNVSNRATSTPVQKNENVVTNNMAEVISTPAEDSRNLKVHSKKSQLLPSRSSSLKRVTFSTPLTNKEHDTVESAEYNSLLYYSATEGQIEDLEDRGDTHMPSTSSNTAANEIQPPPLTDEECTGHEATNEVLSKEENKTLFVSAIDTFSEDKLVETPNNEPTNPAQAHVQVTEVTESKIVTLVTANIRQKVYVRHSNHWKISSSLYCSKNEKLNRDQEASTSSSPSVGDDPYFNPIHIDISETPVAKYTKSTDITTRQITKSPLLLHVTHTEIRPDRILDCDRAHSSDVVLYNEASKSTHKLYPNDGSKKSSVLWLNKIWESFNGLVRTMQRSFHDSDFTPRISPHFTQSVKRYSSELDLTDGQSAKRFKSTDIKGRPPIRPSIELMEHFRTGFSDVRRFVDKATQTYQSDFMSVDYN